jgi:hypothetical protein
MEIDFLYMLTKKMVIDIEEMNHQGPVLICILKRVEKKLTGYFLKGRQ